MARPKPLVPKCRKCSVILTKLNCMKSYLSYGINICNECQRQYEKDQYIKNRIIVLNKLGGKCDCCGEQKIELLSIDHINGGGNQEKKVLRGANLLKKLKLMNESDLSNKYRCLCYNCNYCIGFWGKCQHKI